MSRLNKFLAQPKEIEIEGEKFIVHPLKGKHLHLVIKENNDPVEQEKMATEIVFNSLSPSEPDITREEVSELPVGLLNKLLLAVMDVSGLSEDDRIKKIRESQSGRSTKA